MPATGAHRPPQGAHPTGAPGPPQAPATPWDGSGPTGGGACPPRRPTGAHRGRTPCPHPMAPPQAPVSHPHRRPRRPTVPDPVAPHAGTATGAHGRARTRPQAPGRARTVRPMTRAGTGGAPVRPMTGRPSDRGRAVRPVASDCDSECGSDSETHIGHGARSGQGAHRGRMGRHVTVSVGPTVTDICAIDTGSGTDLCVLPSHAHALSKAQLCNSPRPPTHPADASTAPPLDTEPEARRLNRSSLLEKDGFRRDIRFPAWR